MAVCVLLTSLTEEGKKKLRSHPEKIKGQRILLVDDVFTTGATVNECARVLTRAGAESVDVLTLARAVWGYR